MTPPKRRRLYTTDGEPPRTPNGLKKTPLRLHGDTPGGGRYRLATGLGRFKTGSTWLHMGNGAAGDQAETKSNRRKDDDYKYGYG